MKHNSLAALLCCFQGGWWENIWGMLLTLQSFPYDCSLRGSMPPLLGLSRPAMDHCLNKKEPDKTVQLRTSLKDFLAALLLIFLNMGGKTPNCFSTCFGGYFFWSHLLNPCSCILISASWPFICPMDLGEITDVLTSLAGLCPLDGCISQFNQYLTWPCPVISSNKRWRCPVVAPCQFPFPSVVRCNSPRKRNHLQVALAMREGCGLSSWELGMHFLGIRSKRRKFKYIQTLQTLQRVLLLRSMSLLGRCKASSGLWSRKKVVGYTTALISPCQKLSIFF